MYRRTPYKKTASNQKFWRFSNIWAWVAVIVLILLIFPLYRYIRNQHQKNVDQSERQEKEVKLTENQNPVIQQTKADKITTRKDVQTAAQELAHHLGTKYSDAGNWWDFLNPRGWTENDKKVADIVITQRYNYNLLKQLYYECYSNSRDLTTDILKLVDASELARIRKYLNI